MLEKANLEQVSKIQQHKEAYQRASEKIKEGSITMLAKELGLTEELVRYYWERVP